MAIPATEATLRVNYYEPSFGYFTGWIAIKDNISIPFLFNASSRNEGWSILSRNHLSSQPLPSRSCFHRL